MTQSAPTIRSGGPRFREYAAVPVAVQPILINSDLKILLLSSPRRQQGWQLVNGALEAGETLMEGTRRELHEELGSKIQTAALGTVHTGTFRYDDQIPFMLESYHLFAYLGGPIIPGDDMAGSEARWWSMNEIAQSDHGFHPTVQLEILQRALDLYQTWLEKQQPG
jgi:8-oxo-dGTP pyrophosphatase MutT (NUDIX family)